MDTSEGPKQSIKRRTIHLGQDPISQICTEKSELRLQQPGDGATELWRDKIKVAIVFGSFWRLSFQDEKWCGQFWQMVCSDSSDPRQFYFGSHRWPLKEENADAGPSTVLPFFACDLQAVMINCQERGSCHLAYDLCALCPNHLLRDLNSCLSIGTASPPICVMVKGVCNVATPSLLSHHVPAGLMLAICEGTFLFHT